MMRKTSIYNTKILRNKYQNSLQNRKSMTIFTIICLIIPILISIIVIRLPIVAGMNHSGSTSGNESWAKADSPHYIVSDFTISNGDTLTIEAGSDIILSANTNLYVSGIILAKGSINKLINFTSSNYLNQPQAGDWGCIKFNQICDATNSVFEFCNISYATTGINLNYTSPLIRNNYINMCTNGVFLNWSSSSFFYNNITNNVNTGITVINSSPIIRLNNVSTNDNAIYIADESSPNIETNTFFDNDIGIYCDESSAASIINNYFYNDDIAIKIEDSDLPSVMKNLIKYSQTTGIEIIGSSNLIEDNTIETSNTGINISSFSDPTLSFNQIESNTGAGISVYTSSNPILNGNLIQSNKYGIECIGTTPSIINNIIKDNNIQDIYISGGSTPLIKGNEFDSSNIDMADVVPYDISYSESDLEDGDSITVTFFVKNSGAVLVTDVLVRVYSASEDPESLPPHAYSQFGTNKYVTLYPDQNTSLSVTSTVDGGMTIIKVVVDVNDEVFESDENNELFGPELPVAEIIKSNWQVSGSETYSDQIVKADGLEILPGGSVTFHAGMLIIDPGEFNGDNGIIVRSGGTLIIESQSIIKSTQLDLYYNFDTYGKLTISDFSQIFNTYDGIHLYNGVSIDTSIVSAIIAEGYDSGIYFDNVEDNLDIQHNEINDNAVGIIFNEAETKIENNSIRYNDYGILVTGESTISMINDTVWDNTNGQIEVDAYDELNLLDVEFDPDDTSVADGGIINVIRNCYISVLNSSFSFHEYNVDVTVNQDGGSIYEGNSGQTGKCDWVPIRKAIIDGDGKALSEYEIVVGEGRIPREGYITALKGWTDGFPLDAETSQNMGMGSINIERRGDYGIYFDYEYELTRMTADDYITLSVDCHYEERGTMKEKWSYVVVVYALRSKHTNTEFPSRIPVEVPFPSGNDDLEYGIAVDIDGKSAVRTYTKTDRYGFEDSGTKKLSITLDAHAVQWYYIMVKGYWYQGSWICGNMPVNPNIKKEEKWSFFSYDGGQVSGDFTVGLAKNEVIKANATAWYTPRNAKLYSAPIYQGKHEMILKTDTGPLLGNFSMEVYKRNLDTGAWNIDPADPYGESYSGGLFVPITCIVDATGGRYTVIIDIIPPFLSVEIEYSYPFIEWKCVITARQEHPPYDVDSEISYVFSDDNTWSDIW